MMNKTLRFLVAAGMLSGLGIALDNSGAEARGSSPLVGTVAVGSDRSCFNEAEYGAVRNDCSTARRWILPLIYDNAGGMTVQVAARGVNGTARVVSCRAYSVSSSGGSLRTSSWVSTTRHDGVTEYLKMGIDAHGWGSAHVSCTKDPGTLIRNYHY
jgi:hypothetical protein